eukprot:TCALIF_05874-PA protein Name:"Protein of unknown function" AED:0.29 eAED:0.29 QI:0/-1/0/1/-1/1/1/0/299
MSRSASVSGDEEQEYHEDSLPDLVLDAFPHHGYPQSRPNSISLSSSLDLLTLAGGGPSRLEDRCSDFLSTSEGWNESEYSSSGANEEVTTEVSTQSGVFKITYVDHRKAYVIPKVGSSKHESKYRSYLSLMPEDVTDDPECEVDEKKRAQILSDFTALSFEEQQNQRLTWAQELLQTEDEIAVLKEKLAFKTAWCGVLRRNLGLTTWKKLSTTCVEYMAHLKETSSHLQQALGTTETRILSSQSLQKAKDSFEQLSNEVKDRMKQGGAEFVKKISIQNKPNELDFRLHKDQETPSSMPE